MKVSRLYYQSYTKVKLVFKRGTRIEDFNMMNVRLEKI